MANEVMFTPMLYLIHYLINYLIHIHFLINMLNTQMFLMMSQRVIYLPWLINELKPFNYFK